MNGSASIIIIVVGLLLLYAGITGKLDCFLDACNTCQKQGSGVTTGTGIGAGAPTGSFTPATYQDLLKLPSGIPTFNGSTLTI